MILKGYILTFLYILIVLLISGIIKKLVKKESELPRKIVHVLVMFSWIGIIYFFKGTMHIVIPGLMFTIINYISFKKNIFFMIERDNNETMGTVYYALSIFILSTLIYINDDFLVPATIGLFCMSFGDGLAPLFGHIYPVKTFANKKTLMGSLSVLVISFLVALGVLKFYSIHFNLLLVAIISISSFLLEFFSKKGLDNLFLPLGVSFIVYLLLFLEVFDGIFT